MFFYWIDEFQVFIFSFSMLTALNLRMFLVPFVMLKYIILLLQRGGTDARFCSCCRDSGCHYIHYQYTSGESILVRGSADAESFQQISQLYFLLFSREFIWCTPIVGELSWWYSCTTFPSRHLHSTSPANVSCFWFSDPIQGNNDTIKRDNSWMLRWKSNGINLFLDFFLCFSWMFC